jgi:SAM-dependent methyltransferase
MKRPIWEMVNKTDVDFRGESHKARARREREGWFDKYCQHDCSGLDIGCGPDPVHDTFDVWDCELGHGDATFLDGIEDNSYQTVYSSHLLEHILFPTMAVARWYRAVKPSGHLIICVPHRDLFEKQKEPPSRWNPDHKWFWLPEKAEPPATKSLKGVVLEAIPGANIVSLRTLSDGYRHDLEDHEHPCGEYSIEIIVRK